MMLARLVDGIADTYGLTHAMTVKLAGLLILLSVMISDTATVMIIPVLTFLLGVLFSGLLLVSKFSSRLAVLESTVENMKEVRADIKEIFRLLRDDKQNLLKP